MLTQRLPTGWSIGLRDAPEQYVCPDGEPTASPDKGGVPCVRKTFLCSSFAEAVDIVKEIAAIAQRINHHPDMALTHFNRVSVELSSVTAGGVTERDLHFVELIEQRFKD